MEKVKETVRYVFSNEQSAALYADQERARAKEEGFEITKIVVTNKQKKKAGEVIATYSLLDITYKYREEYEEEEAI